MKHKITITVFLAIAAACFIHLGTPSLYETDEGFAANRADSFYRHHTWRLSFDDVGEDGPQFRKPPLLYWSVATLYHVMGRTMWAVRLPTAVAGFLCAWLTWRLARRFFDSTTGLLAALLLVSTPFVLLHIRTAMLEMPLVCLMLAAACSFTFFRHPVRRVAGVGLAAGAAVLLKGGAGAYVLVVPLIFGLIYRRFSLAAVGEAILACLVAAVLPVAYFVAVPPEYRMTMIHRLFIEEASERIRLFSHVLERLPAAVKVLQNTLGWHVPAAAFGFLLVAAGIRRHNAWERAAFLALVIVAALPLLWVYASMVHPFPRYLLPAYPLLLILSVAFVRGAFSFRWPILWLMPFAIAAGGMGPSPWRWIPAGIAGSIGLLTLWLSFRTHGVKETDALTKDHFSPFRKGLSWVLLAGITVPSVFIPSASMYHPGPDRGPRPELVPLAKRLQELVPDDGKVVVEERMKCHTILFYGRRSIDSMEDWLLTAARPGESRYGIFLHAPPRDIPGVDVAKIDQSGSWQLLKVTLTSTNVPWAGILFAKESQRAAMATMLDVMAVEAVPFDKGFVLQRIPDSGPLVEQPLFHGDREGQRPITRDAPFVILPGTSFWVTFPSPTVCAGFDLIPATKREQVEGWKVEYRLQGSDVWTLQCSVEKPLANSYAITNGRLEKTSKRGLRLRFAPVTAVQWKFTRMSGFPMTLSEVVGIGPRR